MMGKNLSKQIIILKHTCFECNIIDYNKPSCVATRVGSIMSLGYKVERGNGRVTVGNHWVSCEYLLPQDRDVFLL